MNKKPS